MALRRALGAQFLQYQHGCELLRTDGADMPPVERAENPRHVPQVHDRQPSGGQLCLMRVADPLRSVSLRAL